MGDVDRRDLAGLDLAHPYRLRASGRPSERLRLEPAGEPDASSGTRDEPALAVDDEEGQPDGTGREVLAAGDDRDVLAWSTPQSLEGMRNRLLPD